MPDPYTDLEVYKSGRNITVSNGPVLLKLSHRDGGYVQEFYGVDQSQHPRMILSTIHRSLIPFTEHRVTADPMLITRRRHLFEANRESLRMVYSDAEVTKDEDKIVVKLSGRIADTDLSCTIVMPRGSKFISVTLDAGFEQAKRAPILEYLMASYAFLPDEMLHSSYERPDYAWAPSLRPEDDHIIGERSFKTAVAVVQRGKLLAALIPDRDRRENLPVALDLDLTNGLLWAPLLSYGYCSTEADGPFSRHDFSMLLKPDSSHISFGFDLYVDADAKTKDGYIPVQEFIWKKALDRLDCAQAQPVSPTLSQDLPTAYLIKSAPGSIDHIVQAEQIINELISRQRPDGMFHLPGEKTDTEAYHTEGMTEICRWLLAIHRDTGSDSRLLQACRAYGDFLVANQLPSGSIPSHFMLDLSPSPERRQTLLTAASGRFLVELYEATGKHAYLAAATNAAKFVTNLASRLNYRNRKSHSPTDADVHDSHTLILHQKADMVRYIAELFIALHRITNEQHYLKSGIAALAHMCWFQDTWTDRIGAFGAGNAHIGDADHASMGKVLLEYYSATKKAEYLERGLAAIRAGLLAGQSSAAATQVWAEEVFGSALIDVRRRTAYAIGQCRIETIGFQSGTVDLNVRNGFKSKNHSLAIRFIGLRSQSCLVSINGEVKRYPKVELETGIKITLEVEEERNGTKAVSSSETGIYSKQRAVNLRY